MTNRAPSAALLEAVERALNPYKGVLSEETIETMREEALLQLSAHPYSRAILQALVERPVLQQSTELAREATDSGEAKTTPLPAASGAAKKGGAGR